MGWNLACGSKAADVPVVSINRIANSADGLASLIGMTVATRNLT
jgi:hypothetical protein